MEEQAGAALGLGQLQLVQVPVTTATVEGLHATYVDASAANKDAEPVICHTLPLPEGFQVRSCSGFMFKPRSLLLLSFCYCHLLSLTYSVNSCCSKESGHL